MTQKHFSENLSEQKELILINPNKTARNLEEIIFELLEQRYSPQDIIFNLSFWLALLSINKNGNTDISNKIQEGVKAALSAHSNNIINEENIISYDDFTISYRKEKREKSKESKKQTHTSTMTIN